MKEAQPIEWKESWRDEYLRWICGFANAEGSVLVIGRNDKGEVVGVKDASRLLQDIPNKVRDILGIMVDVNLVEEAGKETVEIVVEPYPSPVSYKGEYHYRSGSTKQEWKGVALHRFLLRKQGRHWDDAPVPGFDALGCSQSGLQLFRTRAAKSERVSEEVLYDSDNTLLENLQLREGCYLRRAAPLLFSDQPEKFAPGAYGKSDPQDQKQSQTGTEGKAPSTDTPTLGGEESFATWCKDIVLSIVLDRGVWSTDHATFLLSCRGFGLG
jgi:ATP-dependent DNA helicase RecG